MGAGAEIITDRMPLLLLTPNRSHAVLTAISRKTCRP